jgi:hypothetical protein
MASGDTYHPAGERIEEDRRGQKREGGQSGNRTSAQVIKGVSE